MKLKLYFIVFIQKIFPVLNLNIVMFDVPSHSKFGDSVELSCIYDLKKDRLYSIKWYKNDVEFYRYVPKDWPPGQFLPMAGIRVDMQKSGKNVVYLRQVDLNSAGKYRCEVSAEAPSFNTAEAEKEMKVHVSPQEGPKITGLSARYKVGDIVSANCSSAKSKPAPKLRWFLNKKEVPADWTIDHSTVLHSDGLESSSSNLQFILNSNHFSGPKNQILRLKCLSILAKMNTLSNEVLIFRIVQQSTEKRPTQNKESNEVLPFGSDLNWNKANSASQISKLNGKLTKIFCLNLNMDLNLFGYNIYKSMDQLMDIKLFKYLKNLKLFDYNLSLLFEYKLNLLYNLDLILFSLFIHKLLFLIY